VQSALPGGGNSVGACGSVWRAIQYASVDPGPEEPVQLEDFAVSEKQFGAARGTRASRQPARSLALGHDTPGMTGSHNQAASAPTASAATNAPIIRTWRTLVTVAARANRVNAPTTSGGDHPSALPLVRRQAGRLRVPPGARVESVLAAG